MTAPVADLLHEREKRGRSAVEYACVGDALTHQLALLQELRDLVGAELLVESAEVDERLMTLMRVQRSVIDSYRRHLDALAEGRSS